MCLHFIFTINRCFVFFSIIFLSIRSTAATLMWPFMDALFSSLLLMLHIVPSCCIPTCFLHSCEHLVELASGSLWPIWDKTLESAVSNQPLLLWIQSSFMF
ncbi:hypothetical protein XELAEV_18031357mg [Xenopus laevis]|uniref:Uncharacterized protein n=1 Tax=Xenopus laevis TaxID=8355 RepID=A0A974CMG0_XENLA|nr:hypothetical protein XELAEV_18031357mg [Xenopus laevis]